MKTIIIFFAFLFIYFTTKSSAQTEPTEQEFRAITSKLIFGTTTPPLTQVSLDLTKDPKLKFNARIARFENNAIWQFLNLEGTLKTNNGYAPLFGGGEINANPQLAISHSIMLIKRKNEPSINKGLPKVRGLNDRRFHFFWITPKYEYQYSEYTTILDYDKDTILFINQISDTLYHRHKLSLGINYVATVGRDTCNLLKHTFHANTDFVIKINDNNTSILKDVKAITYKTYYDSTLQKQRIVEEQKNISGKSGTITTFNSFSINTNFTYIYRTTKSNYLALNINASPNFNLSDGSVILPLGIGLYFPVLLPKKNDSKKKKTCCDCPIDNNKASIFNIGFVFKVSNILTGNDSREFKDRIDFGIAINVPLATL